VSGSVCLSDEILQAVIDRRLSDEELPAVLAHTDSCATCRELLAAAGAAAAPSETAGGPGPAGEVLARGVTLGRYIIMDLVGAGAMGQVHSAYDPELDRKVAIKILRATNPGDALQGRLLREAKAMARLSHPNVLPVHDAGRFGDGIFVAMELVEGETLSHWLGARRRSQREVVRVFREAGRGLAAAHRAGIVHRDFKPDNVLIGTDGRICVGDFGLARPVGAEAEAAGMAGAARADALTHTGQLVGTPAYMAPEQVGGKATPASDQFSFCVALHEALYGKRPYAGDTVGEILGAVAKEAVQPPPAEARVPAFIRRVVLRGLRARPEDRFASMEDLLAALERDPARALRRVVVVGLAVTALAVTAGVTWRLSRRSAPPVCANAEAELAGIWGPAQRQAIRAAIIDSGKPYTSDVADLVERNLDDYARGWAASYTESCEATRVKGTQSAELFDLRMQCLARARGDLHAVADVLAQSVPGLADQAVKAAYGLPPLERCRAAATLGARIPPPSDQASAARIEELRSKLSAVRALIGAGRYPEAREAAPQLAEAAAQLGYLPVRAEALLVLADAENQRREVDAAIASYRLAFRAASAGGHERAAAEALVGEIWCSGVLQNHWKEGREIAADAQVLVERLGDTKLAANLEYDQAAIASDTGDQAQARTRFTRALEMRERLYGPDSPDVASVLAAIGFVDLQLGLLRESREYQERALALEEKLHHPFVGNTLEGLGKLAWSTGDYEEALGFLERARAIHLEARGPESLSVAQTTIMLAGVRAALGEYRPALAAIGPARKTLVAGAGENDNNVVLADQILVELRVGLGNYEPALADAERLLAERRADLSNDPDLVVAALLAVASARGALGQVDAALAATGEAVETARRLHPGPHPLRARADVCHCRALVDAGRADGAKAACAGADGEAVRAFGDAHPLVAEARALAGEAELLAGHPETAQPPLERALAFLEPRRGDVLVRARARFALARVLAATHAPAERGRALARAARAELAALGSADLRPLDALDHWLAAN
jgi:tetratricopeptide (TPR) repeat protein/tRNA A-37 threonylcarbamoyl transferase component Bud32